MTSNIEVIRIFSHEFESVPRLATQSAPEHLIHPAPGAVTRSIIAVCVSESLDHPPVREVWDALDSLDA